MPEEYNPEENTGVILGRRPTDFVAAEAAGVIPYEVVNPSGDWRPYLPAGERQSSVPAPTTGERDSMSCVTFSAENSIETQEKQQTGKDANYSDRWTAVESGTTINGNYLWKVADTIRKMGLAPNSLYPAPATPWDFNEYHKPIPESLRNQLKAEGLKWLEKWEIFYEWIPVTKESLLHHLKQAPLQLVYPSHAVVGILCEADVVRLFDSYIRSGNFQNTKRYDQLTDCLKIVLKRKESTMFPAKKIKVVRPDGSTAFGVAVFTPNMINVTLAEDEAEWRSYGKLDSYGVTTVNADGSTNYDTDFTWNVPQ